MLRNTECSVTSQKTAAKETTGLTPKVVHTTRSRPCVTDVFFRLAVVGQMEKATDVTQADPLLGLCFLFEYKNVT